MKGALCLYSLRAEHLKVVSPQGPSFLFLPLGASIYDVRTRGGSPKSRQKEQNQLTYVRDKGGG